MNRAKTTKPKFTSKADALGEFIDEPMARLRHERRVSASMALDYLDPMDAATICTAVMESMETNGPQHDVFAHVRSDAALWADCAPPHEIAAYTLAGLSRLRNSPTGLITRKAVFVELWHGFVIADRNAFLAKVAAQNRCNRRAA